VIARLRAWLRRQWERPGPYDWVREDPDLRHNGGHVHHVRPVGRHPEQSRLKGRREC
jgi:hypothetical protein